MLGVFCPPLAKLFLGSQAVSPGATVDRSAGAAQSCSGMRISPCDRVHPPGLQAGMQRP